MIVIDAFSTVDFAFVETLSTRLISGDAKLAGVPGLEDRVELI